MYCKLIIVLTILSCSISSRAQISGYESEIDAPRELEEIRALLLSESDMDSVVKKVIKNSYALKMAEAEYFSLKEEVKIEGKSWMKSFTIGLNLFGYSVTPTQTEEIRGTTQVSVLSNAAVTLLISPYDLIGQKNRTKRARHRANMQEMSLYDKTRQVKIYITNKFLNYQAALESYILLENSMMLAEELKAIAEENFKKGSITTQEYNNALSGLMQSRMNLLEVENAVVKAKLEIEVLMGE